MTEEQLRQVRNFLRQVRLLSIETDALGRRLSMERQDAAAEGLRETLSYLSGAENSLDFIINMERKERANPNNGN